MLRSVPKRWHLGDRSRDKGRDGDGAGEGTRVGDKGRDGDGAGWGRVGSEDVGELGPGEAGDGSCRRKARLGLDWLGSGLDDQFVRGSCSHRPWGLEARTLANRSGSQWRVWVFGERLAARKRRRSPKKGGSGGEDILQEHGAGGSGMPRK